MGMKRRVDPMPPPTDEHSHLAGARRVRLVGARPERLAGAQPERLAGAQPLRLAGAFLALADDPGTETPQRSAPRALCALAAGVVLALAAPLAWISPAPRDQPAATVAGKAAGLEVDDEDADGPWTSM
jgi:hypothetical protein